MSTLNVTIIGGGLGGLCLAQGLRGADVTVGVYEGDPTPFARGQGYRIYLDPDANAALRDCLPAEVHRLYTATSGRKTTVGPPSLLNEHLTALFDQDYTDRYASQRPTDDSIVDRLAFRQTLTAGLGDTLHYGKRFTHFAPAAGGRVRVSFADGSTVDTDVLVGADGAGSAVRRQYLPHASAFDTGLRLIYGKTPLTEAVRRDVPDRIVDGFAIIAGPGGRSMAAGGFEFTENPHDAATRLGADVRYEGTGDYLMWALVAPADDVPDDLNEADEDGLVDAALRLTTAWHPAIHRTIAASDPRSRRLLAVRSSAPVPPWPTSNVTLIGDAAHAMFPAGSGTAVALRDARGLSRALRAVAEHGEPLLPAIAGYESAMHGYAWPAVRESYLMAERMGAPSWTELTTLEAQG